MKIWIMTDLEGVAGVQNSPEWCRRGGLFYSKARELLTREVNAAVEGFLAGGAGEILVADGHGPGAVNPDRLHRKAELARNWNTSSLGSFSLQEKNFDFAAWVGQHPMAGTVEGHLCHSGNFGVVQVKVNGIPVGEFGDVALIATEMGVRSIFASGCRAFCREAEDLIPGIETAAVKKGTQKEPGNHLPAEAYREHNKAAVHLHPERAASLIREGAERAVARAREESFGFAELPGPPYERVTIRRGDSSRPPTILRQAHESSLLEAYRSPGVVRELEINPASPELRVLEGREIRGD